MGTLYNIDKGDDREPAAICGSRSTGIDERLQAGLIIRAMTWGLGNMYDYTRRGASLLLFLFLARFLLTSSPRGTRTSTAI